jgi:type IX secretion system PorP/SprF family membrane protein
MKKILLLTLLLIAYFNKAEAQQDPMYTQYMFNQLVINPAYAGSKDRLEATLLYRTQWVGFDGAPETTSLSVHTPIFGQKSNIGASLVHDQIGISENFYFTGYYAYRLDFKKFRVSMGLNAEIKSQQMRWELTNPFDIGDLNIPRTADNITLPNFGAGLYVDSDKFYAGIAIPRLLENDLDYTNGQPVVNSSAQQQRHFYLMGGFIMDVSRDVKFKPAALVKYTDNAPLEVDINGSFLFAEKLWLGATWRTGDSFDVLAQFVLGNMRIGYSFDYSTTQLRNYNQGSHEIMVGILLSNKSKGIHHPRYF